MFYDKDKKIDESQVEAYSEEDTQKIETEDNHEHISAENQLAANDTTNTHLRRLISSNYIEYASYVIKDRAIPEIRDGLKPVQRRILWSLFKMDDGKFNKVANIVGHCMQYHPHGDAPIYEALVGLANKELFIEKQGNFGNIFTGDAAAAARYIEARLNALAKEVLFNSDITEFTDSYDGRNKEPLYLPAKIPVILLVGQEGIAPGMTTRILSHNFREVLEAQVAYLKGEKFQLFPDFLQGGVMNVAEYSDGNGKITIRAKVEIDGRRLIIREIPAMTDTEKLIASIEKAANKNKIKIASINDYTAERIEIEVLPARGYNPEKTLKALYMYTDCSMSVKSSILVIKDNHPVVMTVSEIIRYTTDALVNYLRRELEIELGRLNDKFHEKTLERIFIENRIYKKIEECETYELVLNAVRTGLQKYISDLRREIVDTDIEKLLAIPIRKISRYDINRNLEEIDQINAQIKIVEKNLKSIKKFTIAYLENLIKLYAGNFPRRTEIEEEFEEIDKKAVALNNIKVGWDRGNGYIGSSVKSEESILCNEFDNLICIEKSGRYKIISIPQKIYVGKLFYFNKYDKNTVYSVIYKERSSGKYFIKRSVVSKYIRDKEYNLIPQGCQLELIVIREKSVYECVLEKSRKNKDSSIEADFSKVELRAPGARGFLLTARKITKFVFKGQIDTVQTPETVQESDAIKEEPVIPNIIEEIHEVLEETDLAPAKNDENVLSLFGDDDISDDTKKERKNNQKKDKTKSASAYRKKPTDNKEDDWGIVQPNLGL
ncbi:MAG TPA: DNA topoisomerase IV subunit A [Lentisphaeria bacterium]|nr:MAG: hypothetical protein A2X47_12710 [Lentisphaerae bacterium GWF2_38_69]HBM16936.1 DNA topoisomerase IV subunit A [Lentisphaeria bacterium]